MNLTDLKPAPGSVKRRKVIGRGTGSGHGKTAGRGHKGDKARGQAKLGFEGGQTPLHRRLPKQRGLGTGLSARGFLSGYFKTEYAVVNLSTLEKEFEAGETVTPEALLARRIINSPRDGVKILGKGTLTKALTVHASKFSMTAQAAIEAVGGATFSIDYHGNVTENERVEVVDDTVETGDSEADETGDAGTDSEATA